MNDSKLIITLLNNISINITTTIIRNRQPILIAVSGGQDSICLLFIFIQLKKQWKWAFGILYCNHLWQKNSFYTGSLIVKISYLFNISIYYVTSSNKAFNEDSSRDWRYKTFYRISFFYNYNTVLTGHTLSDKMETILFQFIRGTSPENLVSLNLLKYFSSNKKFIKNPEIKHIYFYPIKNFNILILSFQSMFFGKLLFLAKGLNTVWLSQHSRLFYLIISVQTVQTRDRKLLGYISQEYRKNFVPMRQVSVWKYFVSTLQVIKLSKTTPVRWSSEARLTHWYGVQRTRSLADTEKISCQVLNKKTRLNLNNVFLNHNPTLYVVNKNWYSVPMREAHRNPISVFAKRVKYLPCSFVMPKNLLSCQQTLSLKLYPIFHQNNQLIIKAKNTNNNLKILQIFRNLKVVDVKAEKKKTQHVWIFCKIPVGLATTLQGLQIALLSTVPLFSILLNQYPRNGQAISLQAKKNLNTQSVKNTIEPTKLIVVRPMLLLNRFDLKKLLLFLILPIYPDLTNQKKIYYRNRIRKELLPSLKFFFNPQIEVNFVRFSKILSAEQFYFTSVFQRLKKELYILTENKFILNINLFYTIPIAFRRRLIKQVLVDCTNKNIRFINIEKILNLVQKPQVYVNRPQTTFYSKKILKLKYLLRGRKATSDWKSQNVQTASTNETGCFATNSYIEHILNTKHKNFYDYGNHRFLFNSDARSAQGQSTKPCNRHLPELYYKYNSSIRLQINRVQNINKKLYFSYDIYYRLLSNRFALNYRLFYNESNFDKTKKLNSSLIRKNFLSVMYFVASRRPFNKIDNKAVFDKSNSTTAQVQGLTCGLTIQKKKKDYKIITIYKFHNRKNQFNFKKLV